VKNPHNFRAKKFLLKAQDKERAIICKAMAGPTFWDIGIADNCNENSDSFTSSFGSAYTNGTGLEGRTFFTGSPTFTVKEIEVFEVGD
jgi:hypothetical protein